MNKNLTPQEVKKITSKCLSTVCKEVSECLFLLGVEATEQPLYKDDVEGLAKIKEIRDNAWLAIKNKKS